MIRVELAFSGALLCLAFAALPVLAADLELGERLVAARCAFCHTEAGVYNLVERCSNTKGMAYLDDFLARHYAPDEATRAVVVEYLTCEELRQKYGDEKD
jgi:mono/diheme cytochrome c family protein